MIAVPRTAEEWRSWLQGSVLPYWTATVAAEPAGYLEYLTADGRPDRRPEKTPLVTARLIYAFSHAHVLGLSGAALAAAEHGFRFLAERLWDGGEGGFFHQATAEGAPLDRRKDFYDHAHTLFAMAWLHRASGRTEPIEWAQRIIDFMDAEMADAAAGYREHVLRGDPQPLPRRQNPHMHLLEAFHALYEATGDEQWIARAARLVDLFKRFFFDQETGTLGEFFTADLRPTPGEQGRLREPGHHFEWVWLLHHHARLTRDTSVLEPADRLYRFAVTRGLDGDGSVPAAFTELDRHGTIVDESKLFWPQTEAIKAFLARWEFLGDADAKRRVHAHLDMLFRWFVIDATGRFRNRLARDGRPIAPDLPTRVFYHLFLCASEVLRLAPTLA